MSLYYRQFDFHDLANWQGMDDDEDYFDKYEGIDPDNEECDEEETCEMKRLGLSNKDFW